MKIGVIGYRNHAATLISLCLLHTAVKSILIFHPNPEKLKIINDSWIDTRCSATSEFENLLDLDAVMISAPGKFHCDYIKCLVDHVPAVFCEKPPSINMLEIDYLNQLVGHKKRKIYFNFHMPQSDLFRIVDKVIHDKSIGEFIYSSMIITHGLAHKTVMKNNWRFTSTEIFDSITGNLGIHYINLFERWFGNIEITNVSHRSFGLHDSVDTVSFDIEVENALPSRIVLSYAAPYIDERLFVFSDGYISQENDGIYQYYPRDRFDKKGRFVEPERKKLIGFESLFDQNSAALKSSVDHFLNTTQNKGSFSAIQFQGGLETVRKILQIESRFVR